MRPPRGNSRIPLAALAALASACSCQPPVALRELVDVHMHCDPAQEASCADGPCCQDAFWRQAAAELPAGSRGVLQSLEHFAVNLSIPGAHYGAEQQATLERLATDNQRLARTAAALPGLDYFPSLECWHGARLEGDGTAWAQACKADVDAWVARGAAGFKDHVGKNYSTADNDLERFLGAFNRANGFCAVDAGTASPNRACMGEPGVRYPALEPAWREVLRYILEEKKRVVLSHAADWRGSTDPCHDPLAGALGACGAVTRSHLLDLANWAKQALSPEARRRLVIAHLAFLDDDGATLRQLLDAGVTLDLSNTNAIALAGCAGRELIAAYPRQLLFATDNYLSRACARGSLEAALHALGGRFGERRTFAEGCEPGVTFAGMELGTAQVAGCAAVVPEGTLERVLRDNYRELVGAAR